MALKFCGGCDPEYDRGEYWERLARAAGGRIEWVGLEEAGWRTILLFQACSMACLERELEFEEGVRVVSIRDDRDEPEKIIETLLGAQASGEEGS